MLGFAIGMLEKGYNLIDIVENEAELEPGKKNSSLELELVLKAPLKVF